MFLLFSRRGVRHNPPEAPTIKSAPAKEPENQRLFTRYQVVPLEITVTVLLVAPLPVAGATKVWLPPAASDVQIPLTIVLPVVQPPPVQAIFSLFIVIVLPVFKAADGSVKVILAAVLAIFDRT